MGGARTHLCCILRLEQLGTLVPKPYEYRTFSTPSASPSTTRTKLLLEEYTGIYRNIQKNSLNSCAIKTFLTSENPVIDTYYNYTTLLLASSTLFIQYRQWNVLHNNRNDVQQLCYTTSMAFIFDCISYFITFL